ncbi:NFACT family protein [Kamptonema cortianum]|nr:NFACT family protein [Geitlerinema splendidum]MDK3156088.1 NFACT family protein [Kamptonema cortianum]
MRRISFDSLCLAAVVLECLTCEGGRIQKIVQPDDFTIVLEVYAGSTYWLLLSCHPEFARVHLSSRKPKSSHDIPGFCQSLRKNLSGGRITRIQQRGTDRILDVWVESGEGQFRLVAELMGKHSNLVLVDRNDIVLAAAKWVGKSQSKRPIQAKQPYLPPPFEVRKPLTEASDIEDLANCEGVSPVIRGLIDAGVALQVIQDRYRSGSGGFYYEGLGAYPLDLRALGLEGIEREVFSQSVEQVIGEIESSSRLDSARAGLRVQLERILDARNVALQGLLGAIEAADRAGQTQLKGELILAYQGSIQESDDVLIAYDYEGAEMSIDLDPELSAVENANRYFARARKAKDRIGEVREQFARVEQDAVELRATLARLEAAASVEELGEIRAEADRKKWLHKGGAPKAKEDRPFEGFSVRELISPGGWRVLYGVNATSNDYVTTKLAKGNDWWFHVRGQTSAHVVLMSLGKPEKVQRADIEFAALVAARNSVAKHSTHVAVDYTLKKYVRKPRGSAAGFAVYEREKTIHVDPAVERR